MNIYLPLLPLKTTLEQQVDKVHEECAELIEAMEQNLSDEEKVGELIDILQSVSGAIQILAARGLDIDRAIVNHRIKLINRGWLPIGVHNVRIK